MKKAVVIIRKNIRELERGKCYYWRSAEFARKSYTISALYNMLEYLSAHKDIPEMMALEQFKTKMNEYACINPNASYIYSIAYDTTEYIIDQLL